MDRFNRSDDVDQKNYLEKIMETKKDGKQRRKGKDIQHRMNDSSMCQNPGGELSG